MDIDLLSKMVKELILDNDRVVLPELGCFVAEMVPSTFSDKGYTINPPYRKLYFRARPDNGDSLTKFYAATNNVDMEVADKIIIDFVAELKSVLFSKKTVVFPGLGRMRATKENNVFFIADEDLDIYPAGFGLEPISLKTHQESAAEVTAAVEGLRHILHNPVQEPNPVVEPIPQLVADPKPEPVAEPEEEMTAEPEEEVEMKPLTEAKKKTSASRFFTILLIIVATAAVLLGAYLAVAHLAPDVLDKILYTPEELEILNYKS